MGVAKDIQNAIRTITEQAIVDAPFDKTRRGVVRGINEDNNTYTVHVDGMTYDGVKSTNGSAVHIGDVVDVTYPTNNTSQMVISGITDMTQSEIDDFVQSLGLHGRSICPYDVGDIYETTNSVDPSTKWDGTTWNCDVIEKDYVVEEGVTNGWTWKKYYSGRFDAWLPFTSAGTKTYNSGTPAWLNYTTTTNQFPFTYTSYSCRVNVDTSSSASWAGQWFLNSSRYLQGFSFSSSTSPGTFSFSAQVSGTYKTLVTPPTIYKWRRLS